MNKIYIYGGSGRSASAERGRKGDGLHEAARGEEKSSKHEGLSAVKKQVAAVA